MKKNIEEEINKLDRIVVGILIAGAVFLILIPIFVTQFDWFFDFTNSGQIGDKLGGTTAPIIGAVSALLIYFSFRAQINANRIIQQQIDDQKTEETSKRNFEHQMERYRHLREHIVAFTFEDETLMGKSIYSGSEGLTRFINDTGVSYIRDEIIHKSTHEFTQLRVILKLFDLIIVNIVPNKNDNDSKFVFTLVEILFYQHIWNRIKGMTYNVIENPEKSEVEVYKLFQTIDKVDKELVKLKDIWHD